MSQIGLLLLLLALQLPAAEIRAGCAPSIGAKVFTVVPPDSESVAEAQAAALRTWFVAHVDIKPRKPYRRQSKPIPEPTDIQLSLL